MLVLSVCYTAVPEGGDRSAGTGLRSHGQGKRPQTQLASIAQPNIYHPDDPLAGHRVGERDETDEDVGDSSSLPRPPTIALTHTTPLQKTFTADSNQRHFDLWSKLEKEPKQRADTCSRVTFSFRFVASASSSP